MNPVNRPLNKVFAIIISIALVVIAVVALPGVTYAAPSDKVVTLQNERPELGADQQIEVGLSRSYQVAYLNKALSTDTEIATVTYTAAGSSNNNGIMTITGVKAGLASLTYGNRVGMISAVQYLIIDPDNVSAYRIKEGGEMYFDVPAGPGQGETRPSPVTVTAGQLSRITWSSMNENVATVASNGAITSVGEGATIVTGDFIDKWGTPRYINILVGVGVKQGGDPGYTVTSITIYPPGQTQLIPSLDVGTSKEFIAQVRGIGTVPQGVTWEVTGNYSAGTTINSDGLLTIAPDELVERVIIRATSTANYNVSRIVYVIIRYPFTVTSIMISPTGESSFAPQLNAGDSLKFTAQVKGTGEVPQDVTWEVSGNKSSGTHINSDGLLTVALDESSNSVLIRATSIANTRVSKTQYISITYP